MASTPIHSMLSWLFVIQPQARLDAPLLVQAVTVGYPVADLAMLAVALRLVLGTGSRSPSFFLLSGNMFAIFAADTLYTLQQLHNTYSAGNFLDAIWLAGNLALGAAAMHPTSAQVGWPARPTWTSPFSTSVNTSALSTTVARTWIPGCRVRNSARKLGSMCSPGTVLAASAAGHQST